MSRLQAGSYISIKETFVGARWLAIFLVLFSLTPSARATELTDLGEGLSYLRIHSVEETSKGMSSAVRERSALILDLRHATTTAESSAQLRDALQARTAKAPVFVLVGPATPPDLGEIFASAADKIIILGIKESVPTPQIIIDQPATTDLLAYEALDSGQPLTTLISGKISKERYDEAALMKEFTGGNLNAAPPALPDPTAKPADIEKSSAPAANAGETAAAPPATPLIDRVLQRAVHLHRALAAIKQR